MPAQKVREPDQELAEDREREGGGDYNGILVFCQQNEFIWNCIFFPQVRNITSS